MSQRKGTTKTPAVIALSPLKNCLVNLPQALVSVLVNSNTAAQNVIVELSWRVKAPPTAGPITGPATVTRQAFAGWTGMASKRTPQQPPNSFPGATARQANMDGCVEIDTAFARNVGLTEGSKVNVILHVDPPLAHTIHIEPLTASDWEIIELHATFLELNMLSQIRALTFAHPLTVYLSPTSTASVRVQRLEPDDAASAFGFAKISPDAEVIVAPKTRQRRASQRAETKRNDGESISTAKRGKRRDDGSGMRGGPVFFRAVSLPHEVFEPTEEQKGAYCVYLDPEVLSIPNLRGCAFVSVIVVRPPGLAPPLEPDQGLPDAAGANGVKDVHEGLNPGTKIVARLLRWENAPDLKHIAISPLLADALDIKSIVGGVIRVEAAHQQLAKTAMSKVIIRPYAASTMSPAANTEPSSLRWAGKDWKSDLAVRRVKEVLSAKSMWGEDILSGPLTDRMILPRIPDSPLYGGGIVLFEPANNSDVKHGWILGGDRKYILELGPEITIPRPHTSLSSGTELPAVQFEDIVGVDKTVENVTTLMMRSASVLLAGARGSGKTSLLSVIAHTLSKDHLFNILPVPCAKMGDDRLQLIKETLTRTFAEASWLGPCCVIFDDLDRMIPAEVEHVDSTRTRWIAETFGRCVREMKAATKGGNQVVVLATVQAKESVNSLVVGGHIFREIISLKAPNKDGRRKVLEQAVYGRNHRTQEPSSPVGHPVPSTSAAAASAAQASAAAAASAGKKLDLLDIAGATDGYMPGDLQLLVERARHESIVRAVGSSLDDGQGDVVLEKKDFDSALKGFVPAGLRGVKLQTSGASWKDIGGLTETRKILLETLEWPTRYAPIFANCPLRLRSGLLLYGYPGCGKTLLASAVAGECGLNFISVKGPEILNKYIGASEKSVRDLFERASAAKPCVLFFDEFDSIAPKRGHDSTGVTDRVVNQMLTQMDGAEGLDGVYVLAATSRPDLIDPALLRPGRLDKSLLCDLPSHADRVDILRALAVKIKVSSSVELDDLAERTEGYSGADLQAVLYNAHLDAIHEVIARQESQRNEDAAGRKGGKAADSDAADRIEFVSFTMGNADEADETVQSGPARRAWLAERAVMVAKLENLNKQEKAERSASKAQAKQSTTGPAGSRSPAQKQADGKPNGSNDDSDEESGDEDEVVITWKHLEVSLRGTRPSIAPEERRRLNRIYTEFIVGRSGDMPSGQSSNEIGGRSSLM